MTPREWIVVAILMAALAGLILMVRPPAPAPVPQVRPPTPEPEAISFGSWNNEAPP